MSIRFNTLLTAGMLASVAMGADPVTVDDICYRIMSEESAEVEVCAATDGVLYSGDVTVPASIEIDGKDYKVSGIAASAFASSPELENVILPDGILYIGEGCFQNSTSLKKVDIPPSVSDLGEFLFYGCTSLQSISLPEGITMIPDYTFFECAALKNVNIPENVSEIGNRAFTGCVNLEEVNTPRMLAAIGNNAFQGCRSLKEISLPKFIRSVGNSAYSGCASIEEIDLSQTTAELGTSVFSACTSLRNVQLNPSAHNINTDTFADCVSLTEIRLGESLESIGERAFANCRALKIISLPSHLNYIGNYAFSGAGLDSIGFNSLTLDLGEGAFEHCEYLESVIINGVNVIGPRAFSGCLSLSEIEIGESVAEIGTMAFHDCPQLLNIYCRPIIAPIITINTFDLTTETDATLYVQPGMRRNYILATYWERFDNVQESNSFPSHVTVPSQVETIISAESDGAHIFGLVGDVAVYDLSGKLVYRGYSSGDLSIALPKGTYIILAGDKRAKLLV